MSISYIRPRRRFAVCRQVSLKKRSTRAGKGLLVEVSLEGCRVSQVEEGRLAEGDEVNFSVAGFGNLAGVVRWSGNRCAGLRLSPALRRGDMQRLLAVLRPAPEAIEQEPRALAS